MNAVKYLRFLKPAALIVLVVFLAIFPVVISPDDATNTVAVFTLIGAVGVVGWNIFSGYTGYISLGHSVFYGFGAYTLGVLSLDWRLPGGWEPFLLLPLAGLIGALVALPLGWIALRARRHTFVVITIAFVFIFQLLAYNLHDLTGGASGTIMPLTPWVAPYANLPFYYVALALLFLATLVSWWVRHSKFGLGLLAIRDDEDRALSLGVKTGAFKLSAYVLSASFVAMAGAVFTYYVGSAYPEQSFNPVVDLSFALMAFLGGVGTVAGPLLGAFIITPLQQWLDLQFGGQGINLMIYGALFLATILVLPRGIVISLQQYWNRWRMTHSSGRESEAGGRPGGSTHEPGQLRAAQGER